jgi:hypothetical protein
MGRVDMEPVILVNMLALAIQFSDFSPLTQCACTVLCGVYTLVKIIETFKK